MIITVPMICDDSLRNNTIVPLVAKSFERWVLLYSLDKITKDIASGKAKTTIKINENSTIENYLHNLKEVMSLQEQPKSNVTKLPASNPNPAAQTTSAASVGPADFNVMQNSLDINPTWVKLTVKGVPNIVGVKVVPYFMKKNVKPLSVILQKDLSKKLVGALLTSANRSMLSHLWGFLKAIVKIVHWKFSLSGKAKDILHNSSEYGVNTLCCFDEMKAEDLKKLLTNPKNVRRLFMMGWSGFAIIINSSKVVTFCLPQSKGTCTSATFASLYSSFGGSGTAVYNSIEQLSTSFKF